MFSHSSTLRLLTLPERLSDHKQMVDARDSFEDRFLQVMAALGFQQKAELARLLEVDPQLLNNWIKRDRRVGAPSRKLFQDRTGVSVDWLNDGDGEMWLSGRASIKDSGRAAPYLRALSLWDKPADLPPDQYVMLPRLEYYLSAGNGGPDPDSVEAADVAGSAFRSDFAAASGWTSLTHFSMRAKGDSMEPTVQSGAPVVIATNEKTITSGKIYALLIDREPLLKRLDRLPGGRVRVRSDNTSNPAYAPFEVSESEIEIIGRAVWTPLTL